MNTPRTEAAKAWHNENGGYFVSAKTCAHIEHDLIQLRLTSDLQNVCIQEMSEHRVILETKIKELEKRMAAMPNEKS